MYISFAFQKKKNREISLKTYIALHLLSNYSIISITYMSCITLIPLQAYLDINIIMHPAYKFKASIYTHTQSPYPNTPHTTPYTTLHHTTHHQYTTYTSTLTPNYLHHYIPQLHYSTPPTPQQLAGLHHFSVMTCRLVCSSGQRHLSRHRSNARQETLPNGS